MKNIFKDPETQKQFEQDVKNALDNIHKNAARRFLEEQQRNIQKEENKKLYRIKHKTEDKYSTGGRYPNWNSTGKLWNYQNLLKHLKIVQLHFYEGCSVIEYKLEPQQELSLGDVLNDC